MATVLLTALACEEPKEIGLAPTTPLDVLYTDTLTISRTTLQLDSVRSNDQSLALVGRYTDPIFGQVQAQAFLQLQPTRTFAVVDSGTTNPTNPDRIILDSTKVRFPTNGVPSSPSWGVYHGDTTTSQELILSRLTDSLRTTANYDISSPGPAVAAVVARRTIRPRPTVFDTLAYSTPSRVDNALGRELLALANTDAARFTAFGTLVNPAAFRRLVPRDFVLTSNSSPQAAVLGLSPQEGAVIIYYHIRGEATGQAFLFPFVGKRFNQITTNRGGTPLASLRPGQSLAPTTTGRTYVQPGTGITTRLQFPGLSRLLATGRVAINRADLVITPTPTDNPTRRLPPLLALTELDGQNRLTRSATATGVPSLLFTVQRTGPLTRLPTGFTDPQIAVLDPRTNSYTFQVAGYLQSVASGLSPNNGLAILTPSNVLVNQTQGGLSDQSQAVLTDRVWRLVLEGRASVKLLLFYTKSN